MRSDKIKKFMQLAGQEVSSSFRSGSEAERKLGAQLLLSEVLEYVIHGLGVEPEVNGTRITEPDGLDYHVSGEKHDRLEMLDGLADVAYTMYWNAEAFGVPLEEGFELVCDNNLEKFVALPDWKEEARPLGPQEWNCGQDVSWPADVVEVEVIKVDDTFYAVGKDGRGKVRKPSTYKSVDLTHLATAA